MAQANDLTQFLRMAQQTTNDLRTFLDPEYHAQVWHREG